MVDIESAATVGIPSSIGSYASPRQGITVHYNGPALSRGSHANCRAQVRQMHSHHRHGNGWAGIGYHYLVCHHGTVLTGRGLNRVGAHAPGVNSTRIGVQFMLGGNQEPTADQLAGFRDLRAWLAKRGVRNHVTGHRDHTSTSCPGGPLYSRVQSGNWSGGSISSEGDPLIGLSKGDKGQAVKGLQALIQYAGQELPRYGVDGDYGDETAAGLLAVRKSVGSAAEPGWGDEVTGWSYAQLMKAVAKNQ